VDILRITFWLPPPWWPARSDHAQRCLRAVPISKRDTRTQDSTPARTPHLAAMAFVMVLCRVCGLRATQPLCTQGMLPIATGRSCAAQQKIQTTRVTTSTGTAQRAWHPSVATAGVCSSSAPADHRPTCAGRACPRHRASAKSQASRPPRRQRQAHSRGCPSSSVG